MLLPLTVGFVLGLALGSYLPYLPLLILSLLLLGTWALVRLEGLGLLPAVKSHVFYGFLLVGLAYWTIATGTSEGERLLQRVGSAPVHLTGTIVEPVRQGPGWIAFTLSDLILGQGPGGDPVKGRLRVTWRNPDQTLGQGDRIGLAGKVHKPFGRANPGGFNYEAFLKRKGIDAVLSLSGAEQVVLRGSPWGFWRKVDEWRARIRHAAETSLTGPAVGLFLGLMIGEQGFISPEIRDAFMITGTVHILSISGSHLGLVALLAFAGIRQACRFLPPSWFQALSRRITPTQVAALGTIIPVTFYTLLAGSEVATVRALVMILVFLLAVWLGRAEQLLLALAAATLVILAPDPQALYDISFQLSFLSVLAIALVVQWSLQNDDDEALEPVRGSLRSRIGTWVWAFATVTAGVTLATLPLGAYYFNQVAWLGLLCNWLVVPLAGLLLVPLGLASVVWLLVSGSDTLPLGPLHQTLLDWTIELVQWMARMPGGEWHVASPSIPAMLAYYLALLTAAWPGWAGWGGWWAGWGGWWAGWGRWGKRWIRVTGCLTAVLLLAWWVWSPRGRPEEPTFRVAFLDVGQGDACLIELPDGQTVLIDAGTQYGQLNMGRSVVGPYLWDRGIRRLDHVIATHPQRDHVGGLPWVLQKFEVGHFWGNGISREAEVYRKLEETVRQAHVRESVAVQGITILEAGGCRLDVVNPPLQGKGTEPPTKHRSLNNLAVATRLDCGPHTLFFAADLETEGLRRLMETAQPARIQVLKVPHHGAKSSLEPEWIQAVHPDYAVISVGRRNPYGHPSPQALAAYAQVGTRLYRTDRDGAVWITGTLADPGLEVHTARAALPQPVQLGAGMWNQEQANLKRLWRQWLGP